MAATRRRPDIPDYSAQAAGQASLGTAVSRANQDLFNADPLAWFQQKVDADPTYQLPGAYERADEGQGRVVKKGMNNWQKLGMAGALAGAGVGAYGGGVLAAGALGGGGGAAATGTGVGSGEAGSTAVPGILSGASQAGTGIGSGEVAAGGGSTLGKILGALGNRNSNWSNLLLGGLSLLGGDPENFQKRTGFTGAVDPSAAAAQSLQAIRALSADIAANNQPKLRSAVVQAGPAPVSIDGIPFQIGGGLGRDPALDNPSLLEGKKVTDPFGGASASPSPTATRRRQ